MCSHARLVDRVLYVLKSAGIVFGLHEGALHVLAWPSTGGGEQWYTCGIEHSFDDGRNTSRRSLHNEREAVVRDERNVVCFGRHACSICGCGWRILTTCSRGLKAKNKVANAVVTR